MSEKSVVTFNKNLGALLKNIKETFKELKETIDERYVLPLTDSKYLQQFIKNNKHKGNDISNKNEIIFSKDLVLLEYIDFNYIWNHSEITSENKQIIWKYIQSLYLYSLEYGDSINIKDILQNYKDTNIIDNNTSRIVINILNNLSNKQLITYDTKEDSDDFDDTDKGVNPFTLPDLSNIIGKHLMQLVKDVMEDIDIESVQMENPLELIQTLLDGTFSLESDTTGVAVLVKNIIDNLKKKLSSEDLNKKLILQDVKNVLVMFNNITNNKYDINKVLSTLDNDEFQTNFDKIINSLDFEYLLGHIIDILQNVQSESNIDLPNIMSTVKDKLSNINLENLTNIPQLMSMFGNIMGSVNTNEEQGENTSMFQSLLSSLDMGNIGNIGNMGNIVNSVMNDLQMNSGDANSTDVSDIDMQKIFTSVTNHLPSNITQNIPKDVLNKLSGDIDIEALKKMVGNKKNTRVNHSKINQLSRLEKRRERLRKKLEEKKKMLEKKKHM